MFRIASDYARSARPQTKRKIQRRTPKIYCSAREIEEKIDRRSMVLDSLSETGSGREAHPRRRAIGHRCSVAQEEIVILI